MAIAMSPLAAELADQAVIARAADAGFRLAPCDTEGGHLTWEWRRGDEPRPQFTSRRIALHWMDEFLRHDHGAFVPESGPSYPAFASQ
jgi:hypothetical protein